MDDIAAKDMESVSKELKAIFDCNDQVRGIYANFESELERYNEAHHFENNWISFVITDFDRAEAFDRDLESHRRALLLQQLNHPQGQDYLNRVRAELHMLLSDHIDVVCTGFDFWREGGSKDIFKLTRGEKTGNVVHMLIGMREARVYSVIYSLNIMQGK